MATCHRRRARRVRGVADHRHRRHLCPGGAGRRRPAGAWCRRRREQPPDHRGDPDAVGRQVVPDDRRAGLPERAAGAHHLHLRTTAPALPSSPCTPCSHDGSTTSSRAASSRPCSGSTSCCRSLAVVLIGLLAREAFDVATAQRAMVLFVLFPGSVVLSWSYAEPVLIVCAAACLLFLLREQWLFAGLAAALATATRPNAIGVVAACVVAAAMAIWRHRQWWSLVAVALVAARRARVPLVPHGPHRRVGGVAARPARRMERGMELGGHGGAVHVAVPREPARHRGRRHVHAHRPGAGGARLRRLLRHPGAPAVAVDGLRRCRRRVDDRTRDGVGPTTVRVHRLPPRRRRGGVVAETIRPGPPLVGGACCCCRREASPCSR